MAFKPIQILINAKDDASAVFDKLQTKVAAVGAAILGYFSVKAFTGIVKGAADLEQGLSRVQAATGATAAEMVQLRKAAEDAGANSQFSAVQAAGALENLAKAGLSAGDAIKTLPAVMNLAAAGDIDLATSAEYVTKAVNGLGLSFNDAGRVADVLAKGANATNTSVTGLAQALSYSAPLANTLGLSLEQTVAIIGKFADAGIDASRAGTALNSIMAQFSDPASKFRTELAAAGITTVNFNDALHQLAKGGPGAERAINAVGTEAGPALRALLNQGIGKLDELTKSLNSAEGSAAATAKVMQDNLKKSVDALGNAWEYFTNTLGTPVLPVITQAVRDLSASLKSLVADGTAKKVGDALAAGFQSAIAWAKNFAASFDLQALIVRLQAFAAQAQSTFDQVGRYATNAGNVVQTAWGVMAAGTNAVLAAIYGIGGAFATTAQYIMTGVAKLRDALAAVTFGSLSESFRLAAEDARLAAQAFADTAQAMGNKADESLQATADAAQLARDGFMGIANAMNEVGGASDGASKAIGGIATQLQATALANAEAAEKTRAAAAAHQEQAEKAEKARAAQAALRIEYAQAISTGNVQRAAEVMGELRKATDAAAASAENNARKQKEQALVIEAAFARVGVKTKESLRDAAEVARQDFVTIRDSGKATADVVAEAWSKAAQAAIDANEGVVPSWVQSEAATKGYAIQVDEAGKATLKLVQTSAALRGLVSGFDNAAKAAQNYGQALGGLRTPPGAGGAGGGAGSGGPNVVRGGRLPDGTYLRPEDQLGIIDPSQKIKSTQVSGEMRGAGTDLGTRTGIAAFLKAAGVDDDAIARKIANEFADSKGDIPFFNNPGQKKYGGDGGTLSQAVLKAAEQYTFGTANSKAQQPSTIPRPESTRTVRVDLNVNGQSFGSLNTDNAGADLLQDLLQRLGQARSTSAP
ncbi:phage tail tape measure protein [Variovorax atrisoli]|uniref:phage tail tape measure protein n=1 Tax=Variovorax atrisoli TaxID=3394203 RepID=UPI00403FC9EE